MNAPAPIRNEPEIIAIDLRQEALAEINATEKFFDRTCRVLEEGDSLFRATPATMTVASHVAHVAQVVDWFREGSLHDRWNLDFESQVDVTNGVISLAAAQAWLADAFARFRVDLAATSDERLAEPMADNPILQTRPRFHGAGAVVDHCAHHRGALAVYARLLGREPLMPYGEE